MKSPKNFLVCFIVRQFNPIGSELFCLGVVSGAANVVPIVSSKLQLPSHEAAAEVLQR
jgi:hypothetical protein